MMLFITCVLPLFINNENWHNLQYFFFTFFSFAFNFITVTLGEF